MRAPFTGRCTGHLIPEKELPGHVEPPRGQALVRTLNEGGILRQR